MVYRITYIFEEEVEYDSIEDAKRESEQAAEGIADTEMLTIIGVKVEEVK